MDGNKLVNSLGFTAGMQKNKRVGPACFFAPKRFLKKEPIEHVFFQPSGFWKKSVSSAGHIIIIDAASSLEANDLLTIIEQQRKN